MKHKTMALVAALSLGVCACGDYRIDLAGSYQLVRLSGGGEFALTRQEGGATEVILGPKVDLYAVSEKTIAGRLSPTPNGVGKPGYFLADLDKGMILDGLTQEQLDAELRLRGVDHMRLKRPNRIRSFF